MDPTSLETQRRTQEEVFFTCSRYLNFYRGGPDCPDRYTAVCNLRTISKCSRRALRDAARRALSSHGYWEDVPASMPHGVA